MKQNPILRNVLAVGIMVLFIGAEIIPSAAQDERKGDFLYVGGSGPGNYTKIQDAVDNASDGDTVFVFSGLYYENVIVDKAIRLLGESQTATVIDGRKNNGSVVSITAPGVTLKQFTLQNCGDISNAAELYIVSDDNQITENTMNCTVTPHGEEGVWCLNSSGNTIERNTIQNHYCGIWLEYCVDSTISNNTVMNNGDLGIVIGNTKDTTISYNTLTKNKWGIYLRDSCNNTISRNTITRSTYGVFINELDATSAQNKVVENNFMRNTGPDGIFTLAKQSHSKNLWDKNYWDRPHLFPKLIIGRKAVLSLPGIPFHFPPMTLMMPWYTADWHPAQEPFAP
jgi:parallel beta-helix repeat protein